MKKNIYDYKTIMKYIIGAICMAVLLFAGLTYSVSAEGSTGKVHVIVENQSYSVSEGAPWQDVLIDTYIEVMDSMSMSDALISALKNENYGQQGAQGGVITEINGLKANEAGEGSTWLATLNNWFISGGVNEYEVENGDTLRFMYTTSLGAEEGSLYDNKDTRLSSVSIDDGKKELSDFDSDKKTYRLNLPAGTSEIKICPEAVNKNFQVRVYKGINPDRTEKGYKLTDSIPISKGNTITIISGDPSWSSLSASDGASVYTIKLGIDGSFNSIPQVTKEDIVEDLNLGSSYTIDLSTVFSDDDEDDKLEYYVNDDGDSYRKTDKDYTFAPESAGKYYLKFKAKDSSGEESALYTVTLDVDNGTQRQIKISDLENGSVTANRTSAAKGEKVVLTVAPGRDMALRDITALGNNNNKIKLELTDKSSLSSFQYTFIMPGSDVTISAIFEDACLVTMKGIYSTNSVTEMKAYNEEGTEVPVIYFKKNIRNHWFQFHASPGQYNYAVYNTGGKIVKEGNVIVEEKEKTKDVFFKQIIFQALTSYDYAGIYKHGVYVTLKDSEDHIIELSENMSTPAEGGGYISLTYYVELKNAEETFSYSAETVDERVDIGNATGDILCKRQDISVGTSEKIDLQGTVLEGETVFKLSKGAKAQLFTHEGKAYVAKRKIPWSSIDYSDPGYDIYKVKCPRDRSYILVAGGSNTEYRKLTFFFMGPHKDTEVTYELNKKDSTSDINSFAASDDLYTNISNGYLTINEGNTHRLEGFRVTQTVLSTISNNFIEPDMHYNIISGDSVTLSPQMKGDVGREYQEITAVKEGITVIEVTYDDLDIVNQGPLSNSISSTEKYYCNSIAKENTGIVIVNVKGSSGNLKSNVQREYDTVYYTSETILPNGQKQNGTDTASYTFTPTGGDNISVSMHEPMYLNSDWNSGWDDVAPNKDNSYTLNLKEGRNIVRIESGDSVLYDTINAKAVVVKIDNNTHPGDAVSVGDEVSVSFDGLELPVYKMCGIYNPGFPDQTWVEYTLNGNVERIRSMGIQYAIHKYNTLTFTAEKAGEYVLSDGQIHCTHLGSKLGAHQDISLNGAPPNLNAETGKNDPYFCTLPEIKISVAGAEQRVIALINKIDPNDYLGTINEIRAAQDAYDALDEASQKKVTNYNVLKIAYGKVKHVIEVIKAIEALPETVTLNDKDAIENIKNVNSKFKALEKAERDAIYNSSKLTDLMAVIEEQEEREQRIAHVTDLIDRLPNVDNVTADISIQNAIVEAQAAYDALSEDEQREIKNINKLVQLQELLPNLKAAQIVVDEIAAIGDVTEENYSTKKDAILKARSAYEALTAEQKKYVTNYDALDQAEYNYALFQVDEEVRDVMAAIRELYETTDSKGNKIPGPLAQTETNGSATWEIWASWKDYVVNTRGLVNALAQEKLTNIGNIGDLELAENYISTLEVNDVAKLLEALPDASTIAEYIAAEPVTTEVTQIGGEEMAEVADAGIYEDAEEITDVETYEESEENVSAAQKRQLTAAELKVIATAMNAYNNLSEKQQKLLMADRVENLIALDAIACTYAAYNEEYLQMYVDELADYYLRYREKELYRSETAAIQAVVDKYDTYPAESQTVLNTMKAANDTGFAFAAMRTVLIEQLKQVEKDIEAADNLSEWILSLPTNVTAANLDTLEKDIASIEQEYEKLSEPAKTYVRNLEHLKSLKTVAAALRREIDAFGAIQPTVSAKVNSYSSVTVSWKEVADANSYYVYRKSGSGGWKRIASVGTLSYIDQTVSGGTTYYYTVRAVSNKWGGSAISGYNRTGAKAVTPFGGAVSLKSVKAAGYNSVKLTWDKVNGAAGYRIYRATSKNGTYTKIKTISSRNTTAYKDTKLKTGKKYYYKMRAYRMTGSKRIWASYSKVKSAKPVPAAVNLTKVTARSKSAVLKWNKVSGASGYVVYRATSKNGKYTRVARVKSNKLTYTNTKLKSKKAYYYKVRAYRTVKGKNVYGSASTAKRVKAK